jgi:hypothetical protein
MEKEIINKVDQSGLVQINLEDLYLPGERVELDIKSWLFEELILKEKDFRDHVKMHDWQQYSGKFVAVHCSVDAIVPTWAYMIIATNLAPFAADVVFGDLNKLEETIYIKQLSKLNVSDYKDERIVIKGCSDKDVPVGVYVALTHLLQPVVKSIMYGEPCSTVPVFKRK